ncbi:hypothetical protein HZH68_003422 [Vespula germanica]|uniref:Uncharacterized protein n=1 Tax=Vespula germanica TaxID=30212 RepID=A0A834NP46_VESGE|nr:hypothetical protein HZH68_003422 [Vespula germanica]
MSSRNMKAERSSINVGPALLPRESKAGAPSSSTRTTVRRITFWTIFYKRQNRDCQGYHCSLFPDRSFYISSIYLCYVHKARDALQEGNTKLLKSNKVSYGNSELGTLRAGTARIIIDVVAYFTPDVIFQLPSTELSFATLLGSRKTCGSPLPSNSDKRGT